MVNILDFFIIKSVFHFESCYELTVEGWWHVPEILDFRRQKDARQLEASRAVSPRLACLPEQELEELLKGELAIKNPKSNF